MKTVSTATKTAVHIYRKKTKRAPFERLTFTSCPGKKNSKKCPYTCRVGWIHTVQNGKRSANHCFYHFEKRNHDVLHF